MKMFLRQHRGRLFYTGKEGESMWSEHEHQALELSNGQAAEALCAKLNFPDMEILVRYGWNNEVVIPVGPPPEIK